MANNKKNSNISETSNRKSTLNFKTILLTSIVFVAVFEPCLQISKTHEEIDLNSIPSTGIQIENMFTLDKSVQSIRIINRDKDSTLPELDSPRLDYVDTLTQSPLHQFVKFKNSHFKILKIIQSSTVEITVLHNSKTNQTILSFLGREHVLPKNYDELTIRDKLTVSIQVNYVEYELFNYPLKILNSSYHWVMQALLAVRISSEENPLFIVVKFWNVEAAHEDQTLEVLDFTKTNFCSGFQHFYLFTFQTFKVGSVGEYYCMSYSNEQRVAYLQHATKIKLGTKNEEDENAVKEVKIREIQKTEEFDHAQIWQAGQSILGTQQHFEHSKLKAVFWRKGIPVLQWSLENPGVLQNNSIEDLEAFMEDINIRDFRSDFEIFPPQIRYYLYHDSDAESRITSEVYFGFIGTSKKVAKMFRIKEDGVFEDANKIQIPKEDSVNIYADFKSEEKPRIIILKNVVLLVNPQKSDKTDDIINTVYTYSYNDILKQDLSYYWSENKVKNRIALQTYDSIYSEKDYEWKRNQFIIQRVIIRGEDNLDRHIIFKDEDGGEQNFIIKKMVTVEWYQTQKFYLIVILLVIVIVALLLLTFMVIYSYCVSSGQKQNVRSTIAASTSYREIKDVETGTEMLNLDFSNMEV